MLPCSEIGSNHRNRNIYFQVGLGYPAPDPGVTPAFHHIWVINECAPSNTRFQHECDKNFGFTEKAAVANISINSYNIKMAFIVSPSEFMIFMCSLNLMIHKLFILFQNT